MDKFDSLFAESGLSLDRLRNFCLVAEAGGLSKAAGGDPGRMSLYSRQAKELEGFFGVSLTRRHGKGIAITAEGSRLAELIREHLLGLEDFRRNCRALTPRFTLASGNSMIEWVVLPRLRQLRAALPEVQWDVVSLRTADIVARLRDLTLDFGLIREDAAQAAGSSLRSGRLFALNYSLFTPRDLVPDTGFQTLPLLREVLRSLPLAVPSGGQFREQLERSAAKARCPLKLDLTCSSFTQAARAVKSGCYGAFLPSIARVDFDAAQVTENPVPFLRPYSRVVSVAWNPRLMNMRASGAKSAEALQRVLCAADGIQE